MSLTFLPWARPPLAAAGTPPAARGRATLPLRIDVNGTPVFPAPPQLELLGPGDVVGIDPAQIIRTDPPPNATAHEPARYVAIEFDHPALPWLLTPDAPSAQLSPWLCLVVVEQQDGVTIEPGARPGITQLRIEAPATPAAELPDLTQAWAWAHVQVAGTLDGTLDAIETGTPERTLSRLIAPRTLAAFRPYIACVVPATEAGRLAGLGQDPGQAAGAWSAANVEITLPAYYWWTFTTGQEGSFLRLAEQLTGRECPGLGKRTLELADPLLPSGSPLVLAGALQAAHPAPAQPPGDDLRNALAGAIDASTPLLGSPLYGGVYAGASAVAADASGWLAELNLNPCQRVAAALGTAVAQAEQEDLVAAAWDQAGPIMAVNQLLDRARLARATTARLTDRHLAPLEPDVLARVTAPSHTRLMDAGTTVDAALAAHDPARPARLSPAFRRLSRRGAGAPVDPALDGRLKALLLDRVDAESVVPRRVLAGVQLPGTSRTAVSAHAVAQGADSGTDDPLGRALVSPSFPTPMAGALTQLAPEMVLPGITSIPADTVTVATSNPGFVAAFLVGLNTEIGRELAWRGFPAERRATFFRSFWDSRGQGPAVDDLVDLASADSEAPLAALSGRTEDLVLVVRGELLLRYPRTLAYAVPATADGSGPILDDADSELLPLFAGTFVPDVSYFGFALTPAQARGDDGGPGWYFVLQEQATEARFGPPDGGAPALGVTAAEVARDYLRPAARVAISLKQLILPEPA